MTRTHLWQRALLAVFLLSWSLNLAYMAVHVSWLVVPGLLAGWYAADLASGIVHMYMDYRPCPAGKRLNDLFFYEGSRESEEYRRMFRERMATINPLERLGYDFKNHHPRPDALGRRALWRLIGSTVILGTLPLSLLVNASALWLSPPGWAMAFFVTLILGSGFAQYFHGSLHRRDNPWIVNLCRRLHLLMTPAAHQLHHDTLQRDFATNCGWSNGLLNPVFRFLHSRGILRDEGLTPSS